MAKINFRDPTTGDFVTVDMGGTPIGVISAFVGSVAPAGWHLCDGTAHGSAELQAVSGSANAPDLRDRFVVATGATYTPQATGGAATVTLTGAQSGQRAHSHASPVSAVQGTTHTHTWSTNSTGGHHHGNFVKVMSVRETDLAISSSGEEFVLADTAAQRGSLAKTHTHASATSGSGGAHTHTLTIAANAAANATAAHENMPPFYALAFIICTG